MEKIKTFIVNLILRIERRINKRDVKANFESLFNLLVAQEQPDDIVVLDDYIVREMKRYKKMAANFDEPKVSFKKSDTITLNKYGDYYQILISVKYYLKAMEERHGNIEGMEDKLYWAYTSYWNSFGSNLEVLTFPFTIDSCNPMHPIHFETLCNRVVKKEKLKLVNYRGKEIDLK